jgi:hypothetical protein
VQLSGGEIFAHNPAVDQKPKQRTRIARGLRLNQDLGRRIHFAPSNLANDESRGAPINAQVQTSSIFSTAFAPPLGPSPPI